MAPSCTSLLAPARPSRERRSGSPAAGNAEPEPSPVPRASRASLRPAVASPRPPLPLPSPTHSGAAPTHRPVPRAPLTAQEITLLINEYLSSRYPQLADLLAAEIGPGRDVLARGEIDAVERAILGKCGPGAVRVRGEAGARCQVGGRAGARRCPGEL